MAEPNYGTDLELGEEFPAHFPLASGRRNLIRAILRRLTTSAATEAGQEIYDGQCMDLRDYFAARLDAARLPQISREVERCCLYDERIDEATAKTSVNTSQKRLEVAVNLTPAEGPAFTFVLGINSVTVAVLEALSNG